MRRRGVEGRGIVSKRGAAGVGNEVEVVPRGPRSAIGLLDEGLYNALSSVESDPVNLTDPFWEGTIWPESEAMERTAETTTE